MKTLWENTAQKKVNWMYDSTNFLVLFLYKTSEDRELLTLDKNISYLNKHQS